MTHTQNINNTNDPQKKYRFGKVSKNILLEDLTGFTASQPQPMFREGSRHIDIWFTCETPNQSMHHLLEHIHKGIRKENKAKIWTKQ